MKNKKILLMTFLLSLQMLLNAAAPEQSLTVVVAKPTTKPVAAKLTSDQLAQFLGIPVDELQAANLAVRSDFKSFVKSAHPGRALRPASRLGTSAVLAAGVSGTANIVAFTAKDSQLREVIQKYQVASLATRKKFVKAALRML